jgi:hypothetical protein
VSWLRRRHETLNEELLREAGYSPDGTATGAVKTGDPHEPEPEPQPDPASRPAADVSDALGFGSADYAVHAARLDGYLWEIEADPL